MILPLILSTMMTSASDSIVAEEASLSPVSLASASPKTIDVDSIWEGSLWSAAIQFHSAPLQFGGLVDLERELVENVGLQNYEFEIQVWRTFSSKLDVGLSYGHSWLLEIGGTRTGTPGLGVLVSSDALMVRGRYWAKRDRKWQLGPLAGLGYSFGKLTRLPVLKEDWNDDLDEIDLAYAQREIDVSGMRVEAGLAMEVLVHPRFSVGGAMKLTVNAWNGDDDFAYTNPDLKGAGFGNVSVGPEFHAAYRF
jgi:hypothetical protein